jgi:hypothetical protein
MKAVVEQLIYVDSARRDEPWSAPVSQIGWRRRCGWARWSAHRRKEHLDMPAPAALSGMNEALTAVEAIQRGGRNES